MNMYRSSSLVHVTHQIDKENNYRLIYLNREYYRRFMLQVLLYEFVNEGTLTGRSSIEKKFVKGMSREDLIVVSILGGGAIVTFNISNHV